MEVGGKIIPRIRLTSAKDLVEVEAELGNTRPNRIIKDSTGSYTIIHDHPGSHNSIQNQTGQYWIIED